MTRKIIIDTDPGIDDSMAILMALHSPELEVVGLTGVFGNTDVETTTLNALRLVELEGNDNIAVAKGAAKPLVKPLGPLGRHVHGEDGLGNTHLLPPNGKISPLPAAEFIASIILANPGGITLVPIGPLTNIASALNLAPQIAGLVREVVLMGGSAYAGGNVSPVAEANIANDPQAARIVFSAGWPLTMIGLDVTTRTVMTGEYLQRLASSHTRAADFIVRILPVYQDFHRREYGMNGAIHAHDPSAIAYLVDPSMYSTEAMPVFVETEGRCAGQTVPDPRNFWLTGPSVNVCVGVDAPRVLDVIRERLSIEVRR